MQFSSRPRKSENPPRVEDGALAPFAELSVLEVVSATHSLADLTLGLGKIVHDDLGAAK
jgi:acetoacetate decarboxylase